MRNIRPEINPYLIRLVYQALAKEDGAGRHSMHRRPPCSSCATCRKGYSHARPEMPKWDAAAKLYGAKLSPYSPLSPLAEQFSTPVYGAQA